MWVCVCVCVSVCFFLPFVKTLNQLEIHWINWIFICWDWLKESLFEVYVLFMKPLKYQCIAIRTICVQYYSVKLQLKIQHSIPSFMLSMFLYSLLLHLINYNICTLILKSFDIVMFYLIFCMHLVNKIGNTINRYVSNT